MIDGLPLALYVNHPVDSCEIVSGLDKLLVSNQSRELEQSTVGGAIDQQAALDCKQQVIACLLACCVFTSLPQALVYYYRSGYYYYVT